jgi:hypothetical protein
MKEIFKPKTPLEWIFLTAILLSILLFGAWSLNNGGGTSSKPADGPSASAQERPDLVSTAPEKPSAPSTISSSEDGAKPVTFDPAFVAALDAAAQISDPQARRAALEKACYREAGHDPAAAITAAERYSLGDGPGAVLENLAQQWAGTDLNAAYAWVEAKPAGAKRDALAARVAFVWSQSQPAQAANWLVQETEPGPGQQEAIMSIVHQWGLQDMTGATAWVEQFPEGDFRDRAMNELQGIASSQKAPH